MGKKQQIIVNLLITCHFFCVETKGLTKFANPLKLKKSLIKWHLLFLITHKMALFRVPTRSH